MARSDDPHMSDAMSDWFLGRGRYNPAATVADLARQHEDSIVTPEQARRAAGLPEPVGTRAKVRFVDGRPFCRGQVAGRWRSWWIDEGVWPEQNPDWGGFHSEGMGV